MFQGDCIACQYGDHDSHQDVPGPVEEGVMGGWSCPCRGECRDRPRKPYEFIEGDPATPQEVEAMEFLQRASGWSS